MTERTDGLLRKILFRRFRIFRGCSRKKRQRNSLFDWVDYSSLSFGTSYKHFENFGSASVVADYLSEQYKYYYKVSSYHTASYGGQTIVTDHNLVTYAP